MAEMKIFQVELSGIITRDIIWREVDAVDETQARAMFAEALPGYRLRSVIETSKPAHPSTCECPECWQAMEGHSAR